MRKQQIDLTPSKNKRDLFGLFDMNCSKLAKMEIAFKEFM